MDPVSASQMLVDPEMVAVGNGYIETVNVSLWISDWHVELPCAVSTSWNVPFRRSPIPRV